MIAIDCAFNEKALGFSSFTDFLKDIEFIQLSLHEKKRCWQASLVSESTTTPTQSPSLQPTQADNQALKQTYLQFLKKNKWPLLEKSLLDQVIYQLKQLPPLPRTTMPSTIAAKSEGRITESEVRKAVNLLLKSQLINMTSPACTASGRKALFQIDTNQNNLTAVDKAMLSRLFRACNDHQEPLDYKVAQSLTYERHNHRFFEKVQAQCKADLS